MDALESFFRELGLLNWFSESELDQFRADFFDICEVDDDVGTPAFPVFKEILLLLKTNGLLDKNILAKSFKIYQLTELYQQLKALKSLELLTKENTLLALSKNESELFTLLFNKAFESQSLTTRVLYLIADDAQALLRWSLLEVDTLDERLRFEYALNSENPMAVLLSLELIAENDELYRAETHLRQLYPCLSLPLVNQLLAALSDELDKETLFAILSPLKPLARKVSELLDWVKQQGGLDLPMHARVVGEPLLASLMFIVAQGKTQADFTEICKLLDKLTREGFRFSREQEKTLQQELMGSAAYADFIKQQFIIAPMARTAKIPRLYFNTGCFVGFGVVSTVKAFSQGIRMDERLAQTNYPLLAWGDKLRPKLRLDSLSFIPDGLTERLLSSSLWQKPLDQTLQTNDSAPIKRLTS